MLAAHAFALLLLPNSVHAGERKAAKAEALSERAMELMAEEDFPAANRKIGKALKKAPDDPLHHFRQAEIYNTMAARVAEPQLRALLEQAALMHFAWVVDNVEPTDLLAVLARMHLEETKAWMELPDPGCPAEAQAHWDAAEVAFGQHDVAAAQAAYAKAVEGCPEHPTLRVYYGDVFHIQHDFAGAVAQYQVALELEPCHWQAHRFLADSYIALGEVEGTFAHLATSLACNPGYKPAWAQLSGILGHLGIQVDQPVVDKQHMLALVATDSLREGKEPSSEVSINARVWAGYAQALAAEKEQRPEASTLEQERAAVRAALAGLDTDLAPVRWGLPGLQVWSLLARADQAGQLDMAIFVLLHDRELADDFLAWREDKLEDLQKWILENMVIDPKA